MKLNAPQSVWTCRTTWSSSLRCRLHSRWRKRRLSLPSYSEQIRQQKQGQTHLKPTGFDAINGDDDVIIIVVIVLSFFLPFESSGWLGSPSCLSGPLNSGPRHCRHLIGGQFIVCCDGDVKIMTPRVERKTDTRFRIVWKWTFNGSCRFCAWLLFLYYCNIMLRCRF